MIQTYYLLYSFVLNFVPLFTVGVRNAPSSQECCYSPGADGTADVRNAPSSQECCYSPGWDGTADVRSAPSQECCYSPCGDSTADVRNAPSSQECFYSPGGDGTSREKINAFQLFLVNLVFFSTQYYLKNVLLHLFTLVPPACR